MEWRVSAIEMGRQTFATSYCFRDERPRGAFAAEEESFYGRLVYEPTPAGAAALANALGARLRTFPSTTSLAIVPRTQ